MSRKVLGLRVLLVRKTGSSPRCPVAFRARVCLPGWRMHERNAAYLRRALSPSRPPFELQPAALSRARRLYPTPLHRFQG